MGTPSSFNGWSDEIISSFCDASSWFLCGPWRDLIIGMVPVNKFWRFHDKNWRWFSMLLFTFFFDARVFLFFLCGERGKIWGLEGCHKNWEAATKRLNRSGRRASAISAKHFWLVWNLKNIFSSKINLGPSWSFNQCLASIFDNFSICRKNAFWYQSWSFNTCQAFSISFY